VTAVHQIREESCLFLIGVPLRCHYYHAGNKSWKLEIGNEEDMMALTPIGSQARAGNLRVYFELFGW
jgi:hypothetical protein